MPGDVYDMDDREEVSINVLCLLGKIERIADAQIAAAKKPAQPDRTYPTAALEPQPEAGRAQGEEASGEEESDAPTKRRYYRRRDLRPEK
jgi:hypothetical protein